MRLVEKYRPKSFEEMVGQSRAVEILKRIAKRNTIPHLLFYGPPGTGKTTAAMCFAREVFGENWRAFFRETNASDERKIENVRGEIKQISMIKGRRILFLDEADALTYDAQNALRRIMETTKGTIFILSVNQIHKVIDPIKSRCAIIRFAPLTNDDVKQKLIEITKSEGVEVNEEIIDDIVKHSYGDLRKAINYLEQSIDGNKLSPIKFGEVDFVIDALKVAVNGDFERGKELIEDAYISMDYDPNRVVDVLYKAIENLRIDKMLKVKMYYKLGEVERNLLLGANPLIQLVSFIAYVYALPHVGRCPLSES